MDTLVCSGTATLLGFWKGELDVGCVLYVSGPFELAGSTPHEPQMYVLSGCGEMAWEKTTEGTGRRSVVDDRRSLMSLSLVLTATAWGATKRFSIS